MYIIILISNLTSVLAICVCEQKLYNSKSCKYENEIQTSLLVYKNQKIMLGSTVNNLITP